MFGTLFVGLTQPRKESINLKIGQQKLSKLKEKKVGRKTTEHPRASGQYLFNISIDEITIG